MARDGAGGHEPDDRSAHATAPRGGAAAHWEQQALELGRQALEGTPLDDLFDQVADSLQATLQASHVGLVRLLPGTGEAIVELARGWSVIEPGARVPAGPMTQIGYTASTAETVIVRDFGAGDVPFPPSTAVAAEGLVSGVSVAVPAPGSAWGVLAVGSRLADAFTDEHGAVVRAVATVLGAAIRRQELDEQLGARDLVARLAFEVGRLGTWSWDPTTNQVEWSPELEALYGLAPGEFEASFGAFIERIHPDDRELVAGEIERAVSTGTEIYMEHRVVLPGGIVRWFEGRGRAVSVGGGAARWIGIGLDITDRRAIDDEREQLLARERDAREVAEVASSELQSALARLDTLLVSAPVGLGFFDRELRCIRGNGLLAEISGFGVDDVVGRAMREVFAALEPDVGTLARTVIERGVGVDDVEVVGQIADSPGLSRTWLATLHPLRSADAVTGVSIAITEITDRKRAELSERLLHDASELLAATLDRGELLAQFVRLPIGQLADVCTLTMSAADGTPAYAAVAASDRNVEEALRGIAPPTKLASGEETVTGRAIRTGLTTRAEWLADASRLGADASSAAAELAERLNATSAIAVPLRVGGSVVGALTLLYSERSRRRYRAADVPLVEELARHCSDGMELAELRGAATRARARLTLLARVGELMQVELDVSARLQRLTELVLPDLGLTCGAYILEPDGVRLVAFARSDRPSDSFTPGPLHPRDSPLPAVRAISTGEPVRAELAPELVAAAGPRPIGVVGVAPEIGVSQFLGVPLLSGDTPIGALAFGRRERYDDDDVALASEIARRVTPAVGHAIRFERERDTASVLQQSLLPASLPTSPTMRIDARYVSGTAGTRVGGDWYDALELDDGRLLLVIGDVAGHGLGAAALMGQLRTALRVAILEGATPGEMLTRLNRYLLSLAPGEMATCASGIIDPVTGSSVWASAGHPPVALRDRDGTVTWIAVENGPPLGAVRDMVFRDATHAVPLGSTLALYTDGLVERRGEILDIGFDRFAKTLSGALGSPAGMCDHMIDEMLGGEPASDDVALLVAQLMSVAPLRVVVPSDPAQLAETRRALREWLVQRGAGPSELDDLVLATNEVLTNAIEHGGRGGAPDTVLTASADETGVVLDVVDRGVWRAGTTPGGGRGLEIVHALMDEVTIDRGDHGTRVRLRHALAILADAAPAPGPGPEPRTGGRTATERVTDVDLRIERRGSVAIATFVGDVDLANAEELSDELRRLHAPAVRGVVLDLRGVTHLDSSGIRLLFALAQELEGRRVPLALAVADAGIARRVVLLCRFDAAMRQCATVEEAVAAVRAADPAPDRD